MHEVMVDKSQDDPTLLAAWMYYNENLTQEQIAQKLNVSRVTVTRLLQKAKREGIVEVRVTRRLSPQRHLVRKLQDTFGIDEAVVAPTYDSQDNTLDAVGMAAAEYLEQIMFPGCRLGVTGWSTVVARMVPYIRDSVRAKPSVVNELLGSVYGAGRQYNVSARLAQILGAPIETVPSPILVQSDTVLAALMEEPAISTALKHARQCDIALVGLGQPTVDWTMVSVGHITPNQVNYLRRMGVIGDILLRFYDDHGQPVHTDLDDRIVSISWDDIRRIPNILALVSGPSKVEPIIGALRGHLIHCLITDTETAEQVLRYEGVEP